MQAKNVLNTSEAVVSLIDYSNLFKKQPSPDAMKLQYLGKKRKDYHFNMLGYCRIFARRTPDANGVLERGRPSKIKATYGKIFSRGHRDMRETSMWKAPPFQDVFAKSIIEQLAWISEISRTITSLKVRSHV